MLKLNEKLEDKEWKEIYLSGDKGILNNFHGKRLTKDNRIQGNIPFLTAGEQNNGISAFVSNSDLNFFKNVISIDMFGNSFFHDYLCSGDDNIYFFENKNVPSCSKLFIVELINKNKTKFSYGKQFRQKNADTLKIMLPINQKDEPDYEYMEQYTKSAIDQKLEKYVDYAKSIIKDFETKKIEKLGDKEWKEFFLTDIFQKIQRGKRLTTSNQKDGVKPYVSSTALNNGIDNFISNEGNVRIFSDCLTIANSGSVGASFYHPYEFVASDHITHLKQEDMSKFVYLFISTITNELSHKYNFNREINDKRISREKIMLPINEEGNPDYEYMEQYIKNLMNKKVNQYLNYLQKTQSK